MKRRPLQARRQGFTLIEILVTVSLLALLVAVIFPSVSRQIEDAEPTRAANDLANIRTAIETFALNVRLFPGDLEDLAYQVQTGTGTDIAVDGSEYENKHQNRWKGPYIDAALASANTGNATGDALETGFSGQIQNNLGCFDPGTVGSDAFATAAAGACATGEFVTVMVIGLTSSEFESLNKLIDGENETTAEEEGKLRFSGAVATDPDTTFYLALPYSQ